MTSRWNAAIVAGTVTLLGGALVYWERVGQAAGEYQARWGTPSSVAAKILDWTASGEILRHLISTVGIALAGLLMGAVLGILLATLFNAIKVLGDIFTPVMTWLNSLPRVLLVPMFIATMGIGLTSKLMMVVAMTVFIFFFNVISALASVDERLVVNARLLGANRLQILRFVHLPLTTMWILAGMRTALGLAFIGAVISEYFGSTSGIGYLIDISYGMNRYDHAVAGLVVLFAVVAGIDHIMRMVENRFVPTSFKHSTRIGKTKT